MLVVTISTCLILLITIDGEFFSFNHTRKPAITCQQLLGVTLKTLGVILCFLSQGGGGSIPTRGTEREHGGTADTDITRNFLPAE
mgnify:CR=1 FL=1